MKIKSFKLMGHKFTVKYVKRIETSDGSHPYGIYYPEKNLIEIATHSNDDNQKFPQDFIDHTFYHELSHALMLLVNKPVLFHDEDFIDLLGGLLAQFQGTKK